ncbi:MAG: DASS family sodium-coupled anion symporter [Sporomusa sp.]
MFLTAMASNPLICGLALMSGVHISWLDWAIFAFVPGILSLISIPLVLYKIYPPELTSTPEAPQMAREELRKMGPMSRREKVQLSVLILCIVLWMTGTFTKIDATTVTLLGVSILLITGVLDWQDCLNNNNAWDALAWMGVLFTMGELLGRMGVMKWFSITVSGFIAGSSWQFTLFMVVLIYLYSHYFFASLTAHTTALYSPLLVLCLAAGAPPLFSALVLACFSSLCGGITHYSSGPAPILYGAGYVRQSTWWKLGFVVSLILVLVWGISGIFWWKIIGCY